MFKRIIRSLVTFVTIIAAYQGYVLLAVPWMEPPLKERQSQQTREPGDPLPQSITKYQRLLSNYFPPGHWSQTRPPKVIAGANEQAMLVLDDYTRHEDGRVDIARFALLIFPTPPREGITPPRDAIILEAPQGARLQFDDFRPERVQIGQITRGTFPGRITIRSDMREPGPEDDLLVETADLEMNTKLLYTTKPVRFRMGPNVGGGRELEIRFLADEHVQPHDTGLKLVGIDSLEIRRDVRLRMQLETDSLLPGDEVEPGSHAERGNESAKRGNEKPPVEVTCSGPFHFDFVRYVASVDRDVELRQINPNGPSDQLTCNQLDIRFAPRPLPDGQADPVVVDPGRRQQRDLGRLEPAAIIAEGHPVVVVSPARGAEARGDRIQIALRERRVLLGGGRDAVLVYGPNVLRAPAIEYQHPAGDAATKLGWFRAAGPGSLHYLPDPAKPQQVLQATWQTSVELGRDKGQPVLALGGRPKLAFADMGWLTADQIKVYLRELQGTAAAGAGLPLAGGAAGNGKLQLVPDRLAATGRVEIQSAQLTGRSGELLTTFRLPPDATAPAAEVSTDSPAGNLSAELNRPTGGGPPQQAFHIDADRMRIDVQLRGQSAAPTTVACDGNVVFREVPAAATGEQPLEIRGGQLTVDQLDTGTAHITLRGVGATGGASGTQSGSKLAQMTGRGVTVLADVVELDQRDNRLWSDGPGKATMLVTRDLQGQASTTPIPLEISWQGGLRFDGRNVVFEQNVLVAGVDDTLRCDRLSAKLTAPIQFGERFDQQAIDLAEIDCQGQVSIDHRSRDDVGVMSHERVHLARLTINQQTGAISGDGPGVILSTRYGDGLATLAGQKGTSSQGAVAPPPAAGGSKLYFLRVDFQRGLGGNLYTRELTFSQRVRTVYGPVDAWEQELDASRPEILPPESVTLSCDELRLNEDSIAARASASPDDVGRRSIGPVQLQANGNVRIDGQSAAQGAFGAQADRASYEQAKDVFLLEGSGRTPATLWRAGQQGPPPRARKIRYVQSTGEVKIDGIEFFEITPADLENARRPTPPRQ